MTTSTQPVQPEAFEFKSGQFTLPRLRLKINEMDAIADLMDRHVNNAPGFFQNSPVIIDLAELGESSEVDFAWLVGLLRGYGMIPFAVRGASGQQKVMAELMELAVLSDHSPAAAATGRPASGQPAPRKTSTTPGIQTSKLISTPVRSGQRVYAPRGDLIVTAPVSSGAEIIADGNIHIYGTLRGRALAGVKGNRDARIFCHNLQADLVAIAGQYRVNDTLTEQDKNRPVQIYLEDNRLSIQPI